MTRSADENAASCPRCGYDQRGIVATWEESCPLEGTCSECGLRFNWSEVLQPDKYKPGWCVEYAEGIRSIPKATCTTFIGSFWPWRFWSHLRMTSSMRWHRLALYMLLLLLPLLAGYAALQTTAAVRVRQRTVQELAQHQAEAGRWAVIVQQKLDAGEYGELSPEDRQLLLQRIQAMQQIARTGGTIQHSYPAAIIEAILFPWRSNSSGTITFPSGWAAYTPPRSLHEGTGLEERLEAALTAGAYLLWQYLATALSFILLPISRRRAKVRWAHIWRIAAYGWFIPASLAIVLLACTVLEQIASGALKPVLPSARTLWLLAAVALTIWWAVAIKRYLKMPHGAAISILLSVMALLMLLASAFVGGFLFD